MPLVVGWGGEGGRGGREGMGGREEELKEQELKAGGCGVAARKCRTMLDPSCIMLWAV
jgi:hypothetical protein